MRKEYAVVRCNKVLCHLQAVFIAIGVSAFFALIHAEDGTANWAIAAITGLLAPIIAVFAMCVVGIILKEVSLQESLEVRLSVTAAMLKAARLVSCVSVGTIIGVFLNVRAEATLVVFLIWILPLCALVAILIFAIESLVRVAVMKRAATEAAAAG
ncbi:hypothetical protein F4X86_00565 [Candidatus Saccharibacteria bacterium]|nr:hypothetical protein [Candidatus Saccharibacteria bacterium]